MNITTEKLYDALMELKEGVGVINNNIEWIKDEIKDIKERQTNCLSCTNSNYINNQLELNRKDIGYLKKKENIAIGISVAAVFITSIIISLSSMGIIKLS